MKGAQEVNRLSSSWPGKRVGVLGGSFNPAHRGHVLISELALRRLKLDAVWWLISPKNPLKTAKNLASMDERIKAALSLALPRNILISTIEQDLGMTYTADTLAALRFQFPKTRFVWMMGADNLIQMPKWKNWPEIFQIMPVAVFGRPTYSLRAMCSPAARRFARYRISGRSAPLLADMATPAWCFLTEPHDSISATSIREHGTATT